MTPLPAILYPCRVSTAAVIPPLLRQTITGVYGERGRQWCDAAPARIHDACRRWGVRLSASFEEMSYNFVAPGTMLDGTPVVLKAGVPSPEFDDEIAALRHFAGRGAVALLDADPTLAVLLLERVFPGTPLYTLDDDDEETRIAARVMRGLWRDPPDDHQFKSLGDLFQAFARLRDRFHGGTGPLPPNLVALAEALVPPLLESAPPAMLLHGDFHHDNILRAGDQDWRVIDPPGMVGDPAAEPGMFLCNPHARIERTRDLPTLMVRRIDILAADLELDRDRILRWAVAWTVMSACWHIEDGTDGVDFAVRCARGLASLLPD